MHKSTLNQPSHGISGFLTFIYLLLWINRFSTAEIFRRLLLTHVALGSTFKFHHNAGFRQSVSSKSYSFLGLSEYGEAISSSSNETFRQVQWPLSNPVNYFSMWPCLRNVHRSGPPCNIILGLGKGIILLLHIKPKPVVWLLLLILLVTILR